mmetsp:Transcript_3467/g.13749  ORF Transcript_3467/g.13749 Transcript_3467/m.13749 type:complete len:390 (+) Transcript_3467:1250-2419(+)
MRSHPHGFRRDLQHLHGVQRLRPDLLALACLHPGHREGPRFLHAQQEHLRDLLVKEAPPAPLHIHRHAGDPRRRRRDGGRDGPERFWPEALNLVMPRDAEAQSRRETRTVGNQRGVQVAVLAVKVHGEMAAEGDADLEVQLLPGIDGIRLVLVGFPQVAQRVENVLGGHRGELGPKDLLRVELPHLRDRDSHDLEADVLSLAVAVQPQHEVADILRLPLQQRLHSLALALLDGLGGEQVLGVRGLPALIRLGEVKRVQMPRHARHAIQDALSAESALELVHGRRAAATLMRSLGQPGRNRVADRRLLGHHEADRKRHADLDGSGSPAPNHGSQGGARNSAQLRESKRQIREDRRRTEARGRSADHSHAGSGAPLHNVCTRRRGRGQNML